MLAVSGGLIGIALSCTATSLALTACARAVTPQQRSKMLGVISAAGSLGTLVVPLVTQALLAREAWQVAALFFLLLAVGMLPGGILVRRRRRVAGAWCRQGLDARGDRPGDAAAGRSW